MLRHLTTIPVSLALGLSAAQAETLAPVELEPLELNEASLVIVGSDGTEVAYSPEELEAFPTYRMETTTPWRDEAAVFEGVLLEDLLRFHGIYEDTQEIVVSAENDYRTIVTREVFGDIPILVATRVNGEPHVRRARGPIQFVIESEFVAEDSPVSHSDFVWMASRIESHD